MVYAIKTYLWFRYNNTILLYKIRNKKAIWILLAGIFIGTIFEYVASLFQEYIFGTYTWDYSHLKFNIGGRIYLPLCISWGIGALIWIKVGLPIYLKIFNKYYTKAFNIISIIIFIFVIYDITLTSLITNRYVKRFQEIAPKNKIEEYIDINYPNNLVKEKFPKLKIKS